MAHPQTLRTLLIAGSVALAAAPVSAQGIDAPPLTLGRTQDGTLARTDPTINERGRFKVFRIDVKPGQRYTIVMRADDFDSYLSVARQVNGLTDYLASDDDGAGNSNARLRWTPKDPGTYYLVAQSLKVEGVGNFTVRMDTLPAVINTPPRNVALAETYRGDLTETDPSVDDKGAYFDLYRITARKGQRLVINMKSTEFDAVVGIGQMQGDSLNITETDDDGGGDKDARLRYTVPEDGTYIIRAQGLDAGALGAYTLVVTERVVRPSTPVAITAGAPVTGELTETDEEADDGSFFDLYRITARAGETVTITMRSSAVDSYLVLGQMTDGEWSETAHDDDGAGGNHSRIQHTFEAAGEYLIRANTIGAGKTGSYTIRLERSGGAPAARRRGTSGPSESARSDEPEMTIVAPPAPPRRKP
ncbi:MAG: PPC domain-containing protein [Gemmatimonadaceae bacterium]|nr:PPC domain-containing protein [Gemmatimonadaceae bacterium]